MSKTKNGIAKKANRSVMFLFRMGLPFALRPGGTPAGVQKVSKPIPKPGMYNLSNLVIVIILYVNYLFTLFVMKQAPSIKRAKQLHIGFIKRRVWDNMIRPQVGRCGVDRASSSNARGPGFKPRSLRFKKYHYLEA